MPLTDTVRAILTAAALQSDRCVMLSERLPAAARRAVVQSMLKAGLVEEFTTAETHRTWRMEGDQRFSLRATTAGLEAVGTREAGLGQGVLSANLVRLTVRTAAEGVLIAWDCPDKSGLADAWSRCGDLSRHDSDPL